MIEDVDEECVPGLTNTLPKEHTRPWEELTLHERCEHIAYLFVEGLRRAAEERGEVPRRTEPDR